MKIINFSIIFLIFFLGFGSWNIDDLNYRKMEPEIQHTPAIGPKLFYTDLNYTAGSSTATIDYGLIIGQGESNRDPNVMVNAAVTTSTVIPDNNVKWADVDGIISTSYSTTSSWTAVGSITFDDPEGTGSTDIYEGTISLKNIPSSVSVDNYYVIVQAHGPAGAQYTTYDIRPMNFSSVVPPSNPTFELESNSTTAASLIFNYDAGEDAYGDPWLIDESSINFSIDPLVSESNYSITPDQDNGQILIELNNLSQGTDYTASLSFTLVDPTDETNTSSFSEDLTFSTDNIPVINSVEVSSVTDTTVSIRWNVTNTDGLITLFTIYDSTNTLKVALDSSRSTIVDGLDPETTYDDWTLGAWYEDDKVVEYPIPSFTTNPTPFVEPIINSVTISEVTYNSVKVDWEIVDADATVTSITISGTGVNQDVTSNGLIGSTTISGLTAEATYSDWKLVVEWNDEFGDDQTPVEYSIESFTTNPIPFVPPVINSVEVSSVTDTTATVSWDITDTDNTITSITIQDTSNTLATVSDTTITSKTVIGLTAETIYSDWKLVVEWNDEFGDVQTPVEYSISSFTTNPTPFVEPIINSVTTSEITYNSVVVDWDITDTDNTITSIKIQDTSNTLVAVYDTSSTNTIVSGLTSETTYNDWKLVVEWNNEFDESQDPVEYSISSFTTDPLPFGAPVINSVEVSSVTDTTATVSWDITDVDNAVTSIKIQDTSNTLDVISDTSSSITTITGLSPETTYNDWKLVVEWNDEFGDAQTPVEMMIESFNTNLTPFVNPIINSVEVSSVTDTTATVSWDITDTDNTITSITIQDSFRVLYDAKTTLASEATITELDQNETYDDWKLVVEWNDEFGDSQTPVEMMIESFTTDLTPFTSPIINSVEISEISHSSVQISWDIENPNAEIASISIENDGVVIKELSRDLSGVVTIDGLASSTTYSDWKLVVEWNDEFGDAQIPVEESIETFTTLENKNNSENNMLVYSITGLSIAIFIIILFIIIYFLRAR